MAETLDDALRASLKNSAELAAARQEWLAIRESVQTKTSTSDLKATLSVEGNQSYTDTPSSRGYQKSQFASGTVNVGKDLYDGGQTKANMKLAQLQLNQATANYLLIEQKVIFRSIEIYLKVLKSRRDVALNYDNLKRLNAHVDAARIRVGAGAVTPTRLAEAEARQSRAKSNTLEAEVELQNAEDEYHSLTGLIANQFTLPNLPNNLPQSIIEAEKLARSSHPKLQFAIASERVAEQSFDTLKATVSPKISLSLSATSKDTNGSSSDADTWSGSLIFSTPILSTNATRAKARNLAAGYQQAKHARNEALRAVEVAARAAFRTQEAASVNLEAVQRELTAAKLVTDGIASEAQFGQKTTLDLLDAEQAVNDTHLRLVKAEHNSILAAFRLKVSIGALTASAMGFDDVLSNLADIPAPADPFNTTFPFSRRSTD